MVPQTKRRYKPYTIHVLIVETLKKCQDFEVLTSLKSPDSSGAFMKEYRELNVIVLTALCPAHPVKEDAILTYWTNDKGNRCLG